MGERRLDHKEPRTRCWRSLLIRFLLSLGLIGIGFLVWFFGMALAFSGGAQAISKNIDNIAFFLVHAAPFVVGGGIVGLITCIIELIFPMTRRIRKLLCYVPVAVIGVALIVVVIGNEVASRISKQRERQTRQRKQQIIESLSNRGMSVDTHGLPSIITNPAGLPVTDAGLKYLHEHADCLSLRELDFAGTEITDAGLKHFKHGERWWQRWVSRLNLSCTEVTDVGLECLDGFTGLRVLDLHETHVTDAGLEHFRGFELIGSLDLASTDVTDTGLEHLKGFSLLHTLNLAGTRVTDAGLEHLKGFRQLRVLDLHETQVTDAGIRKLQQALQAQGLKIRSSNLKLAGESP